jgi:hypothetical protein
VSRLQGESKPTSSCWAVLDTQAGQAWTNNETLTFRVPVVSAAYRYYRLNITANNGDGTYTDIGELYLYQGTIVGGLTAQTITFPAISNGAANDPPFVLIGTSDSGLPLSYSVVSGPATISGNTVTITGVGLVTIQAAQGGNGSYSAATPVSRSFTVAPGQRGNIADDQIKVWAEIRLSVGEFLQQMFVTGAFAGNAPNQAYFVNCDATTMTQADTLGLA